MPPSRPALAGSGSAGGATFKWQWKQDSGKFADYDQLGGFNQMLEREYQNWLRNPSGSSVYTTPSPGIRRYADDKEQVYRIDFRQMKQINNDTNYERTIQRVPV